MEIENGWITKFRRAPTRNNYQGRNTRECIVMHYTATYDIEPAINWFKNKMSSASAHFIVGVDGEIVQMVSLNDGAWHAGYGVFNGAGNVNRRSIGIEVVNPGYYFKCEDGQYLDWKGERVLQEKLAPYPGMIVASDPWVSETPVYWPAFPEKQLAVIEALVKLLLGAYPSIVDIIAHRDADTLRKLKVDPGPAFPLRRYKLLLDNRSGKHQAA